MNGDVEVEASRPRPLSGGIWTLFSWLRRSERSSSSSSESISSVGSDRTAASFDFLSPIHYKLSAPPVILPPNSPTDSYKKRVHERNLRRQQERNITLHRKYGLWREDVGYDAFSLPPVHKNTSECNSKQGRCRRAASECLQRRAAYVPGKRRAPLPPNITSVSLPRNYKRKRPAPKPPLRLDLIKNKENQEINNNQLQMNSASNNSNQRENNDSEPGRLKQSKEIKVRSEKSFLKQIFENKKRHSAVEISHVKLLPSISELDKQAAEIIETNKMLHNFKNNANVDQSNAIQQNMLPNGNMWMCTKCLRKYNVTIKSCVYCVPKFNKLNELVPAGTQTDSKERQRFNNFLQESEEKKKLKEMLKEMKDSLPKKSKEKELIKNLNLMERNQSTETPTLRIGSSIENSVLHQNNFKIAGQPLLRTSDAIRTQQQKINDNLISKENPQEKINKTESINVDRTNEKSINKNGNKIPMKENDSTNENSQKLTFPHTNVTNEIEKRVINKNMDVKVNVSKYPNVNQDELLGQANIENVHTKNTVLNTNLSTNISIHTPLKISSLLNPIYLPKNKSPLESSTSLVPSDVSEVTDPIKKPDQNLLKPNQSKITSNSTSTSRCRLDPEIVSQIIKKSIEEKQKSKQEKICKKDNIPLFDHAKKRDLINQLELSIAKGDENAAAEAAAKLAKLRLSCSVLSYSSQIVAGPSTSSMFLTNENEANFEFKNVNEKHNSQENAKPLNDSPSKYVTLNENRATNQHDSPKKEENSDNVDNKKNLIDKKTPVNDFEKVLIEIWIEDKVAARGPVQLNILRNSTVADLRQEAENTFGLAVRLQRWIVGKTLCTDDTLPIISLAGPQFTAPFYLCLVEAEDLKIEPVDELRENPEPIILENKNTSGEFYTELIKLEQQALVSNTETFECGVCMEECAIGNGAVLRECIHTFCRECLSDVVRHCEEPVVPCPAIGCPGVLQDREIRALLSEDDYDKWLARGLAAAESGTRNTFHCRTTDCSGWAFCEPGVRRFPCPVCKHNNCVPCQAVHEGVTCEEYQRKLRETVTAVENSNTDEGTQALLNSLISRGEALECPECSAIITKKWGCDWVKCSACKTEICWITKGRRWGPAGRGDTTGGCRCGIDGKRCHPSCGYCHYAVVGGRNMLASEAANTAPSPIASGARMLRNSPDGAHTAIVLKPPTTPAVYLQSRISTGPPRKQMGAMTAPMIPVCTIQAICLAPKPGLYSMPRTTMPDPIIKVDSEEELDPENHKKSLEKLKKIDPDFYNFLEENDENLLNFGVDSGEEGSDKDDEDDSNQDEDKVHLPGPLTVDSDESDFEDEGVKHVSGKVTLKMVAHWQSKLQAGGTVKRSTLITVIKVFNAAMVRATSDDGDSTGEYKVEGSSVFNAVIQMCVLYLPPALKNHLGMEKSDKDPQKSKHFTKLKGYLVSYLKDLLKLLGGVTSENILTVLLKHLHQMSIYIACFTRISKLALKKLLSLWSTGEETVRVLAFLSILRITRNQQTELLHLVLKAMYMTYVKNCKFVSPSTWPGINFMRRSLVEMFALDLNVSYQHVFLYIRQLAIHLRNAIVVQKVENRQAVYNWQFVNSLHLWADLISSTSNKPQLQALLYPLVMVITNTIKLVPTHQYYPLRFHCVEILINLSRETNTFIPVLPYLVEVLSSYDFNKKHKKVSMKPLDFSCILRLAKSQLAENGFKDSVIDRVYALLLEYTASQSHSISFPDMSLLAVLQMKQFLKTCSVANYTKKIRQLLEKIEENSKFIEKERAKISFSLHENKMIAAWEASIKAKGTPLVAFYDNWSKINRIQKRKKITKNDELAGELPMIKRPKIAETEDKPTKIEKKGPLVLFPSDSEDETDNFKLEEDNEKPKVRKVKKKVKKNKMQTVGKEKSVSEDNIPDKDDVVQDFSVKDW
ncbi:uncharacterized protein LOC119832495 [Zerene cesonia]|uniref:uncharacterized protein LOC119832495 n=1 Tax=Zerene cesonia TaxID=33412 RepID=UPI0018E582DB|nr:uncharacterized protein LOC119832495 [Zerene cesonia]